MQGLRVRLHLRAQLSEEQVRGLRGHLHLRAQPTEGPMQPGLWGRLHLRAQPSEEQVRGLRGSLHLRAQPTEGPMQGLLGHLHLRTQPNGAQASARTAGAPPSASTTERGPSVCFFVLCNRHWFNKAPGPDPRGPSWGLPIYPSLLAQTLDLPLPLLGAPVSIGALVKLGCVLSV